MRYLPVLVSLLFTFVNLGSAHAGLIINGSFETLVTPPGSVLAFNSSNPNGIPGWVVAGQIEIVSASVFGLPYDGGQWVDLNGQSGPGSISQTFATVIGGEYQLRFAYANNIVADQAAGRARILDKSSSVLLLTNFSHWNSTTSDMNYQFYTGNFIANTSTTTLVIESTSPGSSGIALDAVSVTAVPEPSVLSRKFGR